MTETEGARVKVGIYGPSRSGKDIAAAYLAAHTRLRYWGPTSKVIAPHAAERLGMNAVEAYRLRHANRPLWRQIGDELRANDPAFLARVTLQRGDINVGVRARVEIEAVRRERLVDIAVWVDRAGIPDDPTLEFGPEMCDVLLPNHWGIPELHGRLRNLALSWGVLKAS